MERRSFQARCKPNRTKGEAAMSDGQTKPISLAANDASAQVEDYDAIVIGTGFMDVARAIFGHVFLNVTDD